MMEQSLHGEVMKTQDLPGVVVSISKNPRGYKLAWDFLRANWHTLIKKSVGPLCAIEGCQTFFTLQLKMLCGDLC